MGKGRLRDKLVSRQQTTFYASRSEDKTTFHCVAAEVSGCPITEAPKIFIERKTWEMFVSLCGRCKTEWMVYLFGESCDKVGVREVGGPNTLITGYYFPPQTATGTSVDVPTGTRPRKGVIGALHSHVNFNAFFSGTDKDHSNWPMEIIVNSRGDYEALIRYKLNCNNWAKGKAEVYLLGEPEGLGELNKALAKGEGLVKKGLAKHAVEDDGKDELPVEVEVEPTARQWPSQFGSYQRSLLPVSSLPSYGGSYHRNERERAVSDSCEGEIVDVADDGSELITIACTACEESGIVDNGPGTAIKSCSKCNGWARLLASGEAIASGPPDGFYIGR